MKAKQRKKVEKKVRPTTLALFLRALTELYPTDNLAPGLSLAWLPPAQVRFSHPVYSEVGCFYASVVRYEGASPRANLEHNLDNRKVVLYRGYASTPEAAVQVLVKQWLEATNSVQALRRPKVKVVRERGRR